MKKALIIGSTVADVIIRIPHLPTTEEDLHPYSQTVSLGGCAYNVSHMLQLFNVPYTLFSPIGTGIYGDYVRSSLSSAGVTTPLSVDEANGCCYCYVEDSGKRTFLSVHGAEYKFYPEWFSSLCPDDISCVYVCGLELEESTGIHILHFLEQNKQLPIYYAPGPRLLCIDKTKQDSLLSLHPILHLNDKEALSYTDKTTVEEAAEALYQLTNNTVIITLGKDGVYCKENPQTAYHIPSHEVPQFDTIGAGDSHIGTIIACLLQNYSLKDALVTANSVSAAVVQIPGALLSKEQFDSLFGK